MQAKTIQRARERQGREAEALLVGKEQECGIVVGMQEALLLRVWAADTADRMTAEEGARGSHRTQVVLVVADLGSLEWHQP